MNLVTVSKKIALLSVLVVLGTVLFHQGVQAQTTPATNQAAALTPEIATADWKACTKAGPGFDSCKTEVASVVIECNRNKTNITTTAWYCTFTYPDKSYVTADPNLFIGAQFKNYDSQGKLVGKSDTGIANVTSPATASTGTLKETNLDTTNGGGVCSFGSTGDFGACMEKILFSLLKKIGFLFLMLATTFAGIAGLLLNWVVYITVFQFGNLIGNNPGLLAAWGVLRDIGNLFLLFGFIFMGISTILSLPGNEFTARKALPGLIIFAILMNFSLFAAEAVIDTSNALGTTLYTQAGQGMCPAGTGFAECATNYGISGSVFKVSGISAIFNFDGDKDKDIVGNDLAGLIEILGLTVFAAVAAFVFFAAVFLFVVRCVVLAFLMVTSPIGFAGMAIPPLHEMATKWWDGLLKQSFFAPIYILLILVSLKFMEGITVALNSVSTDGSVSNLASAFATSGSSNVSMIINFMLIIGFMLGALQMSKSMGAFGADRATKFAGAATFGTAGFVGRRTVGRVSNWSATKIASSKFGRTNPLGRFAYGIANKGATASFDARENAAVRGFAASRHIEIGAPGKEASHGFHGIEEKAVKERTEYAGKLKQTKEEAEQEKALKDANTSRQNTKTNLQTAWEAEKDRLQNEIATAERNNDQDEVRRLKQLQTQNESAHKALVRQIDRETKDANSEIAKLGSDNAKREYAKSIEHSGLTWWQGGTVDSLANHHAAEEILRGINKSENQKVVDAIGSLGGKLGGGGGGGAPAAAGGGGGGH